MGLQIKRCISLLLSVVLIISMIPINSFAMDTGDSEETTSENFTISADSEQNFSENTLIQESEKIKNDIIEEGNSNLETDSDEPDGLEHADDVSQNYAMDASEDDDAVQSITVVTDITLDRNELALTAGGETATLTATVLPEEATDKTVTWSSSAENVATVENGVVTPLAEGTAIITAKAGEFSAECTVKVTAKAIAVTEIVLNQKEMTTVVGEMPAALIATVYPESATDKNIVWESKNTAVATVENGQVTPVSMGTTEIIARTEDGSISDTCVVTVWGTCGTSARWFVDGTTLKIEGSGAISDFANFKAQPWTAARSSITKIELGAGITRIGNFAFTMFSKLTELSIPNDSKLESIGKNAFMSTAKLTSMPLPNSIKTITDTNVANKELHFHGTAAEWEALNYTAKKDVYVLNENGEEIKYEADPYSGKCGNNANWKFAPASGTLTISGNGEVFDYSSATATPWYRHRDSITTVIVEDGITAIGNYAFADGVYGKLITVTLPDTVGKIGAHAFQKDANLENIALQNVVEIGEYAFEKCTSLKTITLSAVTVIGRNAFNNCTGLTDASLGGKTANALSMGLRAFQDCTNLKTVQFANVENIGQYAFMGTALEEVDLTTVKSIGGSAFSGVKSLRTITFGENLTSIDGAAFEGTGIEEVTIPAGVTTMGNGNFNKCLSLKKVVVSEGIEKIPYMTFSGDTALEEVTLPVSLTLVDEYAFDNCTALTKVNYSGNRVQWSKIEIKANNDPLIAAMGIVAVTSITLDRNELALTAGGETATLTATVLPEEATDKTVTWSSSAENVATVENGVVTPLAEGTAIITAKTGEFSAECTVTVTAKTIAVTGIALDQNSLSLEVGESVTLTTTVFPDEATNKSVVWTTSAEKIAVVENGTVMAVSEGVATITVKTVDGNYSAQCQVSVSVPEDAIDLTKFKFRFNNVGADKDLGDNPPILNAVGNNVYYLEAPTQAVIGFHSTTLTITAPDDIKDEFEVVYTTWNTGDGGNHCYGEKSVTSEGGTVTLRDYANPWAQKFEYSDFTIRYGKENKEYTIKLQPYNDLRRLWLYPTESGSSNRLTIEKTGKNEYAASVISGTEYTILAAGGYSTRGGAIPESRICISEVGTANTSQAEHSNESLTLTPKQEGSIDIEIRIVNDNTDPKITETVYKLHLTVTEPPHNPLIFKSFTATLNGEEVPFSGSDYRIPLVTQFDKLIISVFFENAGDDVTYQWECGVGANKFPVGENSNVLTVDTSYTKLQYYYFTCTATSNGVKIKSPTINARRVIPLSVVAPVITTQPVGAQYKLGATPAVLSVEINDKTALAHYQWYSSEEPTREKIELIEGATKSAYSPPTSIPGTKYYCCEVYYTVQNIDSDKTLSDFARVIVSSSDMPWDGDGTPDKPFILSTENDLVELSKNVANGQNYYGVYFQFANNIKLSASWKPIGATKDGSGNGLYGRNIWPFSGTLDGNGHTVIIASGGKPLFGYVRQATIKNLNIQGDDIDGYGLIDCYEVDYGDLGDSNNTPETVDIIDCHILPGTSIRDSGFLGGYASGKNVVRFADCSVAQGVVIGTGMRENATGSLAGEFNGSVKNCSSGATVKGKNKVGGLVGAKGQSMGDCTIVGSTFTGIIESEGSAGGILGNGYDAVTAPNSPCVSIIDCKVSGTVSGKDYVGGILGAEGRYITQCWGNGIGKISNNAFTGTIHSSGSYVGGVIGYMHSLNIYNQVENNYYSDTCGAPKGIGFVKYVDTSCESHETSSGTIYFDTAKELPGITGVDYKNLNRTDDPLGADKDKLCYSEKRTEAYVKSISVSGTYKTEYLTDEKFDETGIIVTATWSNGDVTRPAISEVTFTGFDSSEPGDVTITAKYKDVSTTFVLHIKPKSDVITVKVSVLGDAKHGDTGSVHGLRMGGLTSWVDEMSIEAKTSETAWDVLKRVFDQKGLSADTSFNSTYGSIYIKSINGLGEFDNGKFSGWMYTVNGTHPQVGVSKKYLKQGDVIILHYTDDYTKEEGGMAPAEDTSTAQKVIDLINKIGTVTYTDACKQRIDAARSAYDALTAAEKNKVGSNNLATLTKAEAEYKRLMQAGATDVDNLISKIGTVTANSGPAISNAWNAYNALTAEQKALVKNFNTLQEATQKWNQLKADEVVKLIDKIEEPVTEKSKASIEAARKAYDGLTDAQKRLVTNTKKLTDAEKAYAQLTATPEDKEKAQKVIDLIKKLTNVTLDSEKDIQAARKAYDALTDLQKLLVDNYDVLTTAETKLAMLKAMGKVSDPYISTGDYMEKLGTPGIGAVGGEWMVIGLARSGRTVPGVEDYYKKALEYIESSIDPETNRLHKAKSTDNSRMILALTAIGKDVTNVGGHNLLQGLSDLEYVKYQGNNGPIWALLALDSGNYPAPTGGTTTRQALIDELLRVQTSDGGWTISGDKADSDMTGMALTALAPYYTKDLKVQEAIDKAIARLSEMQDEDGGYSTSYDGTTKIATSESISQVVTALSALGINPDTDERFIKNGSSAIDALLRYYVTGGGFKHVMDGEVDGMGTEQAYYALTAYYRFLIGKTNLYDMTDIINMGGDPVEVPTEPTVPVTTEPTEVEPAKTGFPWWILVICVVGGCGLGMVIAIVIIPKFGKFKKKD